MTPILDRGPRSRALFAAVCAAVLGVEIYIAFINRAGTFRIEGVDPYDVTEFGSGSSVSHAFLMRGDGLHAVSIRLSSDTAATASVQWTLWRGLADQPAEMTPAFEGTESLDLKPGRQWKSLTFTRDGSSRDRWYTIQLRLLEVAPVSTQVAIVASRDNPERGGVLWVNDVRQPGSLFVRADWRGRTLYRRFLADAAPNLPAALRIPAVQWSIVVVFHWAFMVFAYALMTGTGQPPSSDTAS